MTTYYDTVTVKNAPSGTGGALIVYISTKWPIEVGKDVWFTIRKLEDSVENIVRVRKKLRATETAARSPSTDTWDSKRTNGS